MLWDGLESASLHSGGEFTAIRVEFTVTACEFTRLHAEFTVTACEFTRIAAEFTSPHQFPTNPH